MHAKASVLAIKREVYNVPSLVAKEVWTAAPRRQQNRIVARAERRIVQNKGVGARGLETFWLTVKETGC